MDDALQAIELETKMGVYVLKGAYETIAALAKLIIWIANDRIENGHVFAGEKSARTIALMSKPGQPTMIALVDSKTKMAPINKETNEPIVLDDKQKEELAKLLEKVGAHFKFVPDFCDDKVLRVLCPPQDASKVQAIFEQYTVKITNELKQDEKELIQKQSNAHNELEEHRTRKALTECQNIKDAWSNVHGIEETVEEFAKNINPDNVVPHMAYTEEGITEPFDKDIKAADACNMKCYEGSCNYGDKDSCYYYFEKEKILLIREYTNLHDNVKGNVTSNYTFINPITGTTTTFSDATYTPEEWNERIKYDLLKKAGINPMSEAKAFSSKEAATTYANKSIKAVEKFYNRAKQRVKEKIAQTGFPTGDEQSSEELMNFIQEHQKRVLFNFKDPDKYDKIYLIPDVMKFNLNKEKNTLIISIQNSQTRICIDITKAQNFIKEEDGSLSFVVPKNCNCNIYDASNPNKVINTFAAQISKRTKDILMACRQKAEAQGRNMNQNIFSTR